MSERLLLQMLKDAGLADPRFHGRTGYFTASFTEGGLSTACKLGMEGVPRRD